MSLVGDAGALDGAGRRIHAASLGPVRLLDVRPASEAVPFLAGGRALTHAGPPIEPARMAAPLLRALAGAAVVEGWAADLATAQRMVLGGDVALAANHDVGAVAPMAGVIAPSFPVAVVARPGGDTVVTNLCEGVGRAMRFGAFDDAILARLAWLRDHLAPALRAALPPGGLDLAPLIAEAVRMGDDLHQRNVAFTALVAARLEGLAVPARRFLAATPQSGLNLVMAGAKAVLDAGRDEPGSSVVVAIARNGTDVGVQLAGTGAAWATAPAPRPVGRMLPGCEEREPSRDIGDSAITECWGLGGWLAPSAPEVVAAVGGGPELAERARRAAAATGVAAHPLVQPAGWGPQAPPLAIDARRVVASGLAPVIFTGMADAAGEAGQVGVGQVTVPVEAFAAALDRLDTAVAA